jgi:hypothetical protein
MYQILTLVGFASDSVTVNVWHSNMLLKQPYISSQHVAAVAMKFCTLLYKHFHRAFLL